MRVPGIIVARTDAEAANLIDSRADERDQPFLLGATNLKIPPYKACFLAMMRRFYDLGRHRAQRPPALRPARRRVRRRRRLARAPRHHRRDRRGGVGAWQDGRRASRRRALRQGRVAVRRGLAGRRRPGDLRRGRRRGARVPRARGRAARDERRGLARVRQDARRCTPRGRRPRELGVDVAWDCERAKTPEGYYQVRGGIPYAIAKSLAAAPFADILWMETKTADLADAREFAEADPRRLPGQDAGLQPVAVVQLGHHRHERRRDAGLPRGDRQDGLRLQLHDLRRPPDRRRRRRGVRHRAAAGRHAGAGPAAAQDAAGRIALPHAADAGRRPAQRRRAGRLVRPHRDHQVDGQGLDPAPAPGADRGAEEAARGLAGAVERALPARREAAGAAAAAPRRLRGARAGHLRRRRRREARQRGLRPDQGPARPQHPARCATRTPSPRSCARSA